MRNWYFRILRKVNPLIVRFLSIIFRAWKSWKINWEINWEINWGEKVSITRKREIKPAFIPCLFSQSFLYTFWTCSYFFLHCSILRQWPKSKGTYFLHVKGKSQWNFVSKLILMATLLKAIPTPVLHLWYYVPWSFDCLGGRGCALN